MVNFLAFLVSLLILFPAWATEIDTSNENNMPNAQEEVAPPAPPVSEEIPAVKKNVRPARNKEYTKELFFDQVGNGVVLPPMQLDYDLTQEKGDALRIGNVVFAERNFFFALMPLGKASPDVATLVSRSEADRYALIMRWPEPLFKSGTMEMISKTGAVLWQMEITEAMHESWSRQLAGWKKQLSDRGRMVKNTGLFATQYAEMDLSGKRAPLWNQRDIFRFCLTQTDGRAQSKLCSRWYGTKTYADKKVVMGRARVDAITPRVLVRNENAPLKDDKAVAVDRPTTFFAELLSGASYEFVAQPVKFNLMDIADTVRPGVIRVVGYDTRPTTPSVLMNPDQYTAVTKILGFEATIGDNRKFWMAAINKENPVLYFPGEGGGGIFKQKFTLSEVPRYVARPYLEKTTPTETYYDDYKLYGRKLPEVQLSTDQNSVAVVSRDQSEFIWYFKAADRGEINRSYLNVTYEGKTYRSYFEAYEGYPRELSVRFTGVVVGGQSNILGEAAYNQWFENVFGWTNYWLGRQRWGMSLKAFQGFGQLKVDQAGGKAKLAVQNFDLKYRFTPGLWGRDETVGAMVSYQNVTFGDIKVAMTGVGGFWARSMPRIFDDFLNDYIPFMNHPKWVDMELVYFANSMNSNVKLDTNFNLNFHGKVLWTEHIFGEAGFGLKRFAFTDNQLRQKAALNGIYGTVGLGVNF